MLSGRLRVPGLESLRQILDYFRREAGAGVLRLLGHLVSGPAGLYNQSAYQLSLRLRRRVHGYYTDLVITPSLPLGHKAGNTILVLAEGVPVGLRHPGLVVHLCLDQLHVEVANVRENVVLHTGEVRFN